MATFKEFLEQQVNPPTEQQRIWAKENFSSRVQPDRYGWTDRKVGSGFGTSRAVQSSGNDPYWVTAMGLLPAASRHHVYHRYLPEAGNKGFVNIATEYVGATFE